MEIRLSIPITEEGVLLARAIAADNRGFEMEMFDRDDNVMQFRWEA
jgi:hypothetical protein